MPISEHIKKQFMEFISLQAFDDQYIDREEEKRILEVGVKNGMSVDEGLILIRQVASEKNLVIERDAEERAKEALEQAASDGKVTKKEFNEILALLKKATKDRITEPKMKKRMKKMMEDNGWKAKEGGLIGSKWYSEI
ncbi:MAG: hypothetical protein KAH84_10480 [Thiomargarita sp.]|nr:hypothetical protein [Thiomargarita sp.]